MNCSQLILFMVVIYLTFQCRPGLWKKNLSHKKSQSLNFLEGQSGPSYYYSLEKYYSKLQVYLIDNCQYPKSILKIVLRLNILKSDLLYLNDIDNITIEWSFKNLQDDELTFSQEVHMLNRIKYSVSFEQRKNLNISTDGQTLLQVQFSETKQRMFFKRQIFQIIINLAILISSIYHLLKFTQNHHPTQMNFRTFRIAPISIEALMLLLAAHIQAFTWSYNQTQSTTLRISLSLIICSIIMSSSTLLKYFIINQVTIVRVMIIGLVSFLIVFNYVNISAIPLCLFLRNIMSIVELFFEKQKIIPSSDDSRRFGWVILDLVIFYAAIFSRFFLSYSNSLLLCSFVLETAIIFLVQVGGIHYNLVQLCKTWKSQKKSGNIENFDKLPQKSDNRISQDTIKLI